MNAQSLPIFFVYELGWEEAKVWHGTDLWFFVKTCLCCYAFHVGHIVGMHDPWIKLVIVWYIVLVMLVYRAMNIYKLAFCFLFPSLLFNSSFLVHCSYSFSSLTPTLTLVGHFSSFGAVSCIFDWSVYPFKSRTSITFPERICISLCPKVNKCLSIKKLDKGTFPEWIWISLCPTVNIG